jgi:magnesium transporter
MGTDSGWRRPLNFGGMADTGANAIMQWHDVQDPGHKLLDELAARYSLHPLHVEDCRQSAQRTKLETSESYLFISLKYLTWNDSGRISADDLALFVGADFLVTVHRAPLTLLEPFQSSREELRPDQVLYRVIDRIVESYIPLADKLETSIERLEDQVVGAPRPVVLEKIGEARNTLLELRRVLSATRHVVSQLRHTPNHLISLELSPFLRDVHDDLAIILDTIAGDRDRVAGVLDIYLSSVSNRNAEATKTLTLLGTAALPALVITSAFGMNIEYPPWTKAHSMFAIIMVASLAVTLFLLWYLKREDYLPGGTTSRSTKS